MSRILIFGFGIYLEFGIWNLTLKPVPTGLRVIVSSAGEPRQKRPFVQVHSVDFQSI
jgi:hypothetical protein